MVSGSVARAAAVRISWNARAWSVCSRLSSHEANVMASRAGASGVSQGASRSTVSTSLSRARWAWRRSTRASGLNGGVSPEKRLTLPPGSSTTVWPSS